MVNIQVGDAGRVERVAAAGTLVDMAAGICTALTVAYVALDADAPEDARAFRDMIRRLVNDETMWDAEKMRPHVNGSVCTLALKLPGKKGE